MAVFIEVKVTPEAAANADIRKKLVEVCPVDIFGQTPDETLEIIENNVDECTLCRLCLDVVASGEVKIIKLYDEGRLLE